MRAIAWSFLTTWALTGALATVFALAGRGLCDLLGAHRTGEPPSWTAGQAFFVGLSLHLTLFRLLASWIGVAPACWMSLAIALLLGALGWRGRPSAKTIVRTAGLPLVLGAIFTLTTLSWWQPTTDAVGPFQHLGSIHSGRYADIALYIADAGRVPRLSQPYGQSLLTATNLVLGAAHPVAALSSWVATCLAFLTLVLHGFFRHVLDEWGASCATFLVLFGSLPLSTRHLLVLDNGSPVAMMGYADAVSGVATLVLVVVWWSGWRVAQLPSRALVLPAVVAFAWTMSAAHDIVVLAPAVALDLAIAVARRTRSAGRIVTLSIVLAAGTVVGALHGGLFLPAQLEETIIAPGTSSLATGSEPLVSFDPRLLFGEYRHDRHEWMMRAAGPETRSSADELTMGLIFALRLVFFPLLGIVMLAVVLVLRRREPAVSAGFPPIAWWNAQAAVALAIGFGIAFFLAMRGLKWPLARFMVPGAVMGLASLALAVGTLLPARVPATVRMLAWVLVLVPITMGPLRGLASHVDMLFWGERSPTMVPLERRLRLIFTTPRELVPG
jgi:hypothetical protein